jgi:hypothetical protein
MAEPTNSERLEHLIVKGEAVIQTYQPSPPGAFGYATLGSGPFSEWRNQALACLTSLLGAEHVYVSNFERTVSKAIPSHVQSGNGILKATREDLLAGHLGGRQITSVVTIVERVCVRFHYVARALRRRHQGRPSLDVQDEYDVQDLFGALLEMYFEDIRPEEYTPSYAGKSTRMDFLLKREATVVEMKKTRQGLDAKVLASELIEDIGRYGAHPDCQTLICFVYDPDGLIANPRGIESDLEKLGNSIAVRVFISP